MRAVVLLWSLFFSVHCAKIGVFLGFLDNPSENKFISDIAEDLDRSHDVVLIEYVAGTTASSQKKKIISLGVVATEKLEDYREAVKREVDEDFRYVNYFATKNAAREALQYVCEVALNSTDFMKSIVNENFEISIHLADDECANGLAQYMGSKVIVVEDGSPSRESLEHVSVPTHLSLMPHPVLGVAQHSNILQKTATFVLHIYSQLASIFETSTLQKIQKRLGSHISSNIKAQLLFARADENYEIAVPTTPRVVYLQNFDSTIIKSSEDLRSLLQKAETIVLVSLEDYNEKMTPVLAEIFRYNKDVSFVWIGKHHFDSIDNLFFVPKSDITKVLESSKSKVLLTNGKNENILHAIYSGTPMLIVPQTFSEMRNAALAKQRGIAEVMSKENFTAAVFQKELNHILHFEFLSKTINSLLSGFTSELHVNNTFQLYSLDVIFILTIVALVLRKLLSWYYWSCFEMSYKQKLE
ncbi:unnamed protein product [Caenorhabditis auriculariae]|uniref:glucuronosyltransferase n=1 Tax=Caenorhabditis auriculariae TaxID=2777116 RepID=A0A8S1H162_9PELO|nr:unnamed protein product [Caenorhabditis auriculariae]